jgi:hypothetical protein
MAPTATQLLAELKTLRKGRGVYALKIRGQVGPALRALCGVTGADEPETVRAKVTDRLGGLAETLPADLQVAVRAGLALHPHAQQLFLSQRIQWLAEHLDRDERTARRRLDEGLHRLAEAAAGRGPRAGESLDGAGDEWRVAEFHAVLRLDLPSPEVVERRRIVAERDGLDHIEASVTLPPATEVGAVPGPLLVEMLYGGTIVRQEKIAESRFSFRVELPGALRAGEEHEYAMVFRLPPDQPMRTHYLLVSPRRCDLFDVRVRFDRARLPRAVWRVSAVFYVGLGDVQPAGEELEPDRAGEVHQRFRNPKPGFSYGVLWADP